VEIISLNAYFFEECSSLDLTGLREQGQIDFRQGKGCIICDMTERMTNIDGFETSVILNSLFRLIGLESLVAEENNPELDFYLVALSDADGVKINSVLIPSTKILAEESIGSNDKFIDNARFLRIANKIRLIGCAKLKVLTSYYKIEYFIGDDRHEAWIGADQINFSLWQK